jgi:hypothetical protein
MLKMEQRMCPLEGMTIYQFQVYRQMKPINLTLQPFLFVFTYVATVSADAPAKLIDGKLVAKQVREEIAVQVTRMKDVIGIVPGLAVILVGSRKDSQTYVRNKKKACEAVGIKSYEVNLPEDSSEEEVIKHIASFNSDPSVHGILVQLPLPRVSV